MEEASTTTAEGGSTTSGAPGETTTTAEGATTTAAPGDTTTTASGETTTTVEGATTTAAPGDTTTTAPGETTTTVEGATTTAAPGDTTTTTVEPPVCSELITPREEDIANQQVILPTKPGESADRAGCYELGPAVLTGKSVRGAKARYDGAQGGWLVEVEFKGNDFVEKVAVPYAEQLVAIVLDGAVYSAPNIQPGITGSDVQITGSFSEREAKDLALVLRYGALPVQFDKEQETVQSVSPTLGKDQLRAGIVAGLIGLALVALYMILYYRILGLVVWLGLALTGLFFFTLVSFLSAQIGLAMTLAGVTGLIVSVGVTVDSYVVYFERLKDEVRTGKTIRSSVDVGFTRAFRTILAADLVSLLGAGVLYMLAIGSVRGFAFFLGVSTVIDLVIAYFFMHPLVSMMARRPSLVRMRGLGIAVGLDVPEARA
ncbi:MAG: protein translocase subunit SecD [Acidimicrobiia bacterium]|nr:protein translocase subunit SecD [Acidimicrobiia bacterium]